MHNEEKTTGANSGKGTGAREGCCERLPIAFTSMRAELRRFCVSSVVPAGMCACVRSCCGWGGARLPHVCKLTVASIGQGDRDGGHED